MIPPLVGFTFFGSGRVTTTRQTADAFERVRLHMGMKQERAAHLLGISRVRLVQILSGEGALTYSHIDAMGREADGAVFRDLFHQEMSKVWGVRDWDGVVTELIALAHTVNRGLRMAKASLKPAQEEDERRTA